MSKVESHYYLEHPATFFGGILWPMYFTLYVPLKLLKPIMLHGKKTGEPKPISVRSSNSSKTRVKAEPKSEELIAAEQEVEESLRASAH